jgi:hypothetical protein
LRLEAVVYQRGKPDQARAEKQHRCGLGNRRGAFRYEANDPRTLNEIRDGI